MHQHPQDLTTGQLLKPVNWLHRKRSLLQANQSLAIGNSDVWTQASTDAHGRVLQQLRLSQKKDPCLLATEACLSMAQLHALEAGTDGLFYSPSLRLTAARRVARLLGVEWDDIVNGKVKPPVAREAPNPGVSAMRTAEVIALKPGLYVPALNEQRTPQTDALAVGFSGNALLTTPSLYEPLPPLPSGASHPQPSAGSHRLPTVSPHSQQSASDTVTAARRRWTRGLIALTTTAAALWAFHASGTNLEPLARWPAVIAQSLSTLLKPPLRENLL